MKYATVDELRRARMAGELPLDTLIMVTERTGNDRVLIVADDCRETLFEGSLETEREVRAALGLKPREKRRGSRILTDLPSIWTAVWWIPDLRKITGTALLYPEQPPLNDLLVIRMAFAPRRREEYCTTIPKGQNH